MGLASFCERPLRAHSPPLAPPHQDTRQVAVSQRGPAQETLVCGCLGLGGRLQTCEKQISVFTQQPGRWGRMTRPGAGEGRHHWVQRACVRCSGALLPTPADRTPPGSSVHGVLQAGTLQWVAISFCRGIFPTQGSNLNLLCLPPWQADS